MSCSGAQTSNKALALISLCDLVRGGLAFPDHYYFLERRRETPVCDYPREKLSEITLPFRQGQTMPKQKAEAALFASA